jgi:hypothetical protein
MRRSFLTVDGAKSSAITKWASWVAVKQARRLRQTHPAPVRICWDLDNTLANSGVLIRIGMRLQDAIVEAEPVPNMLEFYKAMRTELPNAEHVILSARMRSMRRDTLAWLHRYGLAPREGAICFVPYAETKPKVWQQLARDTRLVIVDDLSYGHEGNSTSTYHDLVEFAKRTACVYIGLEQITRIAADPNAVEEVSSWAAEILAR